MAGVRVDAVDTAVAPALERDTLYAVIAAVAEGPDPRRMLPPIVDLLTAATGCHACFVYLREGDRLRMRAASRVFAQAVGRVELGIDEGLTGWVARHRRPAFIRERAMEDPRMRYVPELEEERFQSMVAVPLSGRAGDVIGVVVLHTEAPREFGPEVLALLEHVAALVAGAIENARLYEASRRQVAALTTLSALSRDLAAATSRERLYAVATGGARRLLGCEAVRLALLDGTGPEERLEPAAADPPESAAGLAAAGPEDPGRPAALLEAPLVVGSARLGVLTAVAARPFAPEDGGLLRAVASGVAVALERTELIERLTEENAVRDLFAALASGDADAAANRARAARLDLARAHALVCVLPAREVPAARDRRPWADRAELVEGRVRRLVPGSACHATAENVLALVPRPRTADLAAELDRVAREEGLAVGHSAPARGLADGTRRLAEARDAAQVARALRPGGGALAHGELGAYRYLVRLQPGAEPDAVHAEAIRRLMAYDERRRTALVATLERHLAERGNVTAAARALFVHPNTLRQRLARIAEVSGLDVAREDPLSLELALRLARLSEPT